MFRSPSLALRTLTRLVALSAFMGGCSAATSHEPNAESTQSTNEAFSFGFTPQTEYPAIAPLDVPAPLGAPAGVTVISDPGMYFAIFGGPPPASINFGAQQVVIVNAGARPTHGYALAISGVSVTSLFNRVTGIDVSTTETAPGKGCVNAAVSTPLIAVALVSSANLRAGLPLPTPALHAATAQAAACPLPPAAGADADGDGVPDARDLCPATAPGASVDPNGCAAGQASANPPSTGDQANGFTTFVYRLPGGQNPIVLRAQTANVTGDANGYTVSGSILLDTPVGQLPMLLQGQATLAFGPNPGDGLRTLRATAQIPFPFGDWMQQVSTNLPYADLGIDVGANLSSLDAPLNADRTYLFFDVSTAVGASYTAFSFSAPGGHAARLVLDPLDPSIYATGDMLGLGSLGPIQDAAIGLSVQGLIPFTPTTTWGMPDDFVQGFQGNVYAKGTIPFEEYPFEVEGEVVVKVPTSLKAPEFRYGANGKLNLALDFKQLFTAQVQLVQATTQIRLSKGARYAAYSGELKPDTSFIPSWLPINVTTPDLKVAGIASTDINQTMLRAEGDYELGASIQGAPSWLSLRSVPAAKGKLLVDHTGFNLSGTANVSICPLVQASGDVALSAYFPFTPGASGWYVKMDGDAKLFNVPLAQASSTVNAQGLTVNGTFNTAVAAAAMSGTITQSGGALTGTASLDLPIRAPQQQLQTVTDAAVCGGYEYGRDAWCGAQSVVQSIECGTTHYAGDAAKCGYDTVTDGVKCGFDNAASWLCQHLGTSCGNPNTCKVAASCDIANSCSLYPACTHPKHCQQWVTVPNVDFGRVSGTVTVSIDRSGARGAFSGTYVDPSGRATALPSGSVDMTSKTVCLAHLPGVPDVGGGFCGKF